MRCTPAVMAAEDAFMDVLSRTLVLERRGDTLLVTGSGVDLVFEAIPQVSVADVVGITWELEALIMDGTATPYAGDRATVQLNPDGSFVGSTGCRELTGEYAIGADTVFFSDLGADGDCPAELFDVDSFVIGVLDACRVERVKAISCA